MSTLRLPATSDAAIVSEVDSELTHTPTRKTAKPGGLSSLIFRFSKSKANIGKKRAAASLDVPRAEAPILSAPISSPDESSSQLSGSRGTTGGRRSESRILAFLSFRRQSTELSNLNSNVHQQQSQPSTPKAFGDSHPPCSQSRSRADSTNEATFCAVTISAPAFSPIEKPQPRAQHPVSASPSAQRANAKPPHSVRPQNHQQHCTAATGGGGPAARTCQLDTYDEVSSEQYYVAAAASASPPWSLKASPHAAASPVGPLPPPRSRPSPLPAPSPPPPPAPLPSLDDPADSSVLLAMCPGVPPAMRRPRWCLEDYVLQQRLYKAPSSSVYSAVCLHSGLQVALKVYHLALVPLNVLHMLRREIVIQTSISHPHVVMLYGAFQDTPSQQLVLVQELAANGDLHVLQRTLGRRLSEDHTRALVLQPLLEALRAVHGAGVVHRDIKPDNILFTADWRLVLADFGVAIDLKQERAVTRAGTVGYMAPEVERCPIKSHAEDNKNAVHLAYTTTADVWAIGCLAYTLLLGFPPFVSGALAAAPGDRKPGRGGGSGGGAGCLSFPASTSLLARDFICSALAEHPEDRPTVLQLLRHPWMTCLASLSSASSGGGSSGSGA